MSDENVRLRLSIEAVDADTILEAINTRLVIEGRKESVEAIAELVIAAVGGAETITKATTYAGDREEDVTALFKDGPTRLDPLSTGDESV